MLTTALGSKRPGDIIRVALGYARNFLIPTGAAIRVRGNEQVIEANRKSWEVADAKKREEAQKQLEKLQTARIEIKAESGIGNALYGSVTASDIAQILAKDYGISIEKRHLIMNPVKMLGEYNVQVNLYGGVSVKVPLSVLPTSGQV